MPRLSQLRAVIAPAIAASLFAFWPATAAGQAPVAGAHGISQVDHFWWLVRDGDAAVALLSDTLGFALGPRVTYGGDRTAHFAWFEGGEFFEVLPYPERDTDYDAAIRDFLEVHEGAWRMGIQVADTDALAAALAEAGYDVSESAHRRWESLGGRSDLPDDMWSEMRLWDSPGEMLFFWSWEPGADTLRARMPSLHPDAHTSHPNGAVAFGAPRVAVWDLDHRVRELAALGIPAVGEEIEVPHLDATGRRLELEDGTILLVEGNSYASPVLRHVLRRGEGMMGLAIRVESLDRARRMIEARTGRGLDVFEGPEGPSFRVLARGVWLEFVER